MVKAFVAVLLGAVISLPALAAVPFATYSTSSSERVLFSKLKSFNFNSPPAESIREIADLRKHVSDEIAGPVAEFCAAAAIVAEKTNPGTVEAIRPLLGGRTGIDIACYLKCQTCVGKGHTETKCPSCKGSPVCPSCKGKGTIETKKLSGATQKQKCGFCKASGACPRCGGKAVERLECKRCSGLGHYWDFKRAKQWLAGAYPRLKDYLGVPEMAEDIALSLVTVKGALFEGTGTLVDFNGGKYVMADSALLAGAHTISLVGPDGFEIPFSEILCAADRSIVLFKVAGQTQGIFLRLSEKRPQPGTWMWPFASLCNTVFSRKVTVNPADAVLLDTEFSYDGIACGSPVVDSDRKLCGIVAAVTNYPVASSHVILHGGERNIIRTDNLSPGLFTPFDRERYRGALRELSLAAPRISECSNIVLTALHRLTSEGVRANPDLQKKQVMEIREKLAKIPSFPVPRINVFSDQLAKTCSLVDDRCDDIARAMEEMRLQEEYSASEETRIAKEDEENARDIPEAVNSAASDAATGPTSGRTPWIRRAAYFGGGLIVLAVIYTVLYSVVERVRRSRRPKWQPPSPRHVQAYRKPEKIPFRKRAR